MVCIDEPIGSLDVNNARKVVEFIKEYCNRDKKRFILICTHQYSLIKDMIDKTCDIVAIDNSNSKVVGWLLIVQRKLKCTLCQGHL